MQYVVAAALFVHGVAHLVGFVVPFGIATFEDAPYRTELLHGRVPVGHLGARVVGVLWLATALALSVTAYLLLDPPDWWHQVTLGILGFSLALSILGLPDSRIGALVNLGFLLLVGISASGLVPFLAL